MSPVTLHLRGRVLPGYDRELRALIGSLNVSDRVVVHDLVAAGTGRSRRGRARHRSRPDPTVLRKPRAGGPEQDLHVRDGRRGRRRNGHARSPQRAGRDAGRGIRVSAGQPRGTCGARHRARARARASSRLPGRGVPTWSSAASIGRSNSGASSISWPVSPLSLLGVSAWRPART